MDTLRKTYRVLTSALVVLSALVGGASLSAQDLQMALAKPYVQKPKSVTPTSFVATWSNTKKETGKDANSAKMFFRIHVMHEFEAKQDGAYPVAKFKITGSDKETSPQGSWLDKFGSQTGWFSANVSGTANAMRIGVPKPYRQPGLPADVFAMVANLVSPPLNLSNNGGEYNFTFTAKVTEGAGPAKVIVFGYGEEVQGPKSPRPVVKEIEIPNDGNAHTKTVTLSGGTWCHMVTLQFQTPHELEFTDAIKVEQSLKKGDHGYRSAWKGGIIGVHPSLKYRPPHQDEDYPIYAGLDRIEPDHWYQYLGHYQFHVGEKQEEGLLDPRVLDVEAAKLAGERISYRVSVQEKVDTDKGLVVYRSMYSDPAYFDASDDNRVKYKTLGYIEDEYLIPIIYDHALPKKIVHPQGMYSAAIRLDRHKLFDYPTGKIVGIRVAVAAVGQVADNGRFALKSDNDATPYVFIASKLKGDMDATESKLLHIQKTSLKDGWNDILFDKPIAIDPNNPIYAGVAVQDKENTGIVFPLSYKLGERLGGELLYAELPAGSDPKDFVYGNPLSEPRTYFIQLLIQDGDKEPEAIGNISANPAKVMVNNGRIYVEGAYRSLRIYNMAGQIVSSKATLLPGLYLVLVEGATGMTVHHKVTVH